DEHALDGQEPPGADPGGGPVGDALADCGLIVEELVDRVLVLARHPLPGGRDRSLRRHQPASASSSRRICSVSSVFFLISMRILVMCFSPLSDSSAACSSVIRSFCDCRLPASSTIGPAYVA